MYRYKETAKAVWNMYNRNNNNRIGVDMEIWTPYMKLEKIYLNKYEQDRRLS